MNKKLIAIAVAAGLAPMVAQADPTLYGRLQVEVAKYDDGKETNANAATGTNASSRQVTDDQKYGNLGIKGSEDLGNGLSAVYKFEWQVDTTDANGNDGTRESYAGLKGGFGEFQTGSLKQPYKYSGGVTYDPFVATYMEARSRGGMSGKETDGTNAYSAANKKYSVSYSGTAKGSFGHHGYMGNALSYQNDFGPINVWVATSLDDDGSNTGANKDLNAAVKFKGGNFEAFVALAKDNQVTNVNTAASGKGDTDIAEYTATKVGGMFKAGPHKIKVQVEKTEYKGKTNYTASSKTTETDTFGLKGDVLFVGYELGMGNNRLALNYGKETVKDADSANPADDVKTTIDYLALGAFHDFSKKTAVFAGYSTSKSKADTVGAKAVTEKVMSVGMRVSF